jgi:hypothetical protein
VAKRRDWTMAIKWRRLAKLCGLQELAGPPNLPMICRPTVGIYLQFDGGCLRPPMPRGAGHHLLTTERTLQCAAMRI